MNPKFIIAIIIFLTAIIIGAWLLLRPAPPALAPTPTDTTNGSSQVDEDFNATRYLEGANPGETLDATGETEVTVDVEDFVFGTSILKISRGTKVTWVNRGSVNHDVRSDANSPQQGLLSEPLGPGETYSFIFERSGIYQYLCTMHPEAMRGIVEVVETP